MKELIYMSANKAVSAPQNSGESQDTRTVITILLLIFVYPVGVILMWFWSRWKTWVKILITVPLILIPVAIFLIAFLAAVNPAAQIKKAECTKACATNSDKISCISECTAPNVPATSTGGSFPEEFRTSYLEGCTGQGASETYCTCTLTYLEENLTVPEISDATAWTNPTSNAYKVLTQAIKSCK